MVVVPRIVVNLGVYGVDRLLGYGLDRSKRGLSKVGLFSLIRLQLSY